LTAYNFFQTFLNLQLVEINPQLLQAAEEVRLDVVGTVQSSGDHDANQGETTNELVINDSSDTVKPTESRDTRKTSMMVPIIKTYQGGRSRGRPPQDSKCSHCSKMFSSKVEYTISF